MIREREEMSRDHRFEVEFGEQILCCTVCGFCQAVCPVYGLTRRPALNARGKMLILREVLNGHMELEDDTIETLFQCTGCASCENNCPSGVHVTEILRQVRQDMVTAGTCHPAFKGMKDVLEGHGNIYAVNTLPGYTEGRKRNLPAEYVYFAGCVGAFREEEATESTLRLLDRLKVDYTLIDEVCCTGVLEDMGYAVQQSKANMLVERIKATGAKKVITGCPYCFRTFRQQKSYQALAESNIEVVHVAQFFTTKDFGISTDLVVTYHDPCDLGRHAGIYDEPRTTIRRISDNFVEMEHHRDQALCCGAGGGVRGGFPTNSVGMARRRLAEAEAVNVDVLVTECNSCVHNLSNARLRRQNFRVLTTSQFINDLIEKSHGSLSKQEKMKQE
jgi:Fe-S oxidoreductase